MIILVLNCGSSSIKYKLFDIDNKKEMSQGVVEKIGLPDSFLKFNNFEDPKTIVNQAIEEHTAGIELILSTLINSKNAAISSIDEIGAVGHRIAHGGNKFKTSVIIDQDIIEDIEMCADLAPLHNRANLKGVYAIAKILPNIPQVAVFDTSFHQTMPDYAYMYGLPYEYYEKYGIRRYGFHGTSHKYVAKRACEFLGLQLKNSRLITAHIGNGGSVTAINNGKSVDTSMGMTPVEGLMMGTRSGDVDLGIITLLMNKENLSSSQISDIINKKSGLLGVSGISSDMRDIESAVEQGHDKAILALEMYEYHILKYISQYIAVLGGVDAIVFTGGVGENMPSLRQAICEKLEFLGISFNRALNKISKGKEVDLTYPASKVKVVVVPTNEELAIALDTKELLRKINFAS